MCGGCTVLQRGRNFTPHNFSLLGGQCCLQCKLAGCAAKLPECPSCVRAHTGVVIMLQRKNQCRLRSLGALRAQCHGSIARQPAALGALERAAFLGLAELRCGR